MTSAIMIIAPLILVTFLFINPLTPILTSSKDTLGFILAVVPIIHANDARFAVILTFASGTIAAFDASLAAGDLALFAAKTFNAVCRGWFRVAFWMVEGATVVAAHEFCWFCFVRLMFGSSGARERCKYSD